jgi:hypothetical protein
VKKVLEKNLKEVACKLYLCGTAQVAGKIFYERCNEPWNFTKGGAIFDQLSYCQFRN